MQMDDSPSSSPLGEDETRFGSGKVLDEKRREAVRGMLNLGNTCLLNSVMQSLLALEQLRHYFLELDVSPGPLTSSLKKLVVEICEEAGSRSAINLNPQAFLDSVCSIAPQFGGYKQQDSHEFLRWLLDGLSTEELSAKRKKIESTAQEDVKSEPTFVEAVFGGQLCNTVTCTECGHSSVVPEPFLDLSPPLPTKKAQPVEVDNSDAPISVERCLSYFIESELLKKKEHAWQCENCTVKVGRDATKRILIDKAPRVLTIHLKRFIRDDARGCLNKLNGHAQFNTTIDLKPYICPRCMEKDECKYRLVGVVEHIGTMSEGHYVAYVRGKIMKSNANDENSYVWYKANDAIVRESSLEEVLLSDAYILFYERV